MRLSNHLSILFPIITKNPQCFNHTFGMHLIGNANAYKNILWFSKPSQFERCWVLYNPSLFARSSYMTLAFI